MKRKELAHKAQEKGNVKRHTALLAAVLSISVSLCAACLVWLGLDRYERGVLDVCAVQQDAYVQLVLDQINLKENRSDTEIITGILSSLDASTNKYWTFSREQNMLFVKDVLETNKYKGLTTVTYYASNSAQSFLNSLSVNHVIHGEIEIDGREYIASGVAFIYDGAPYRMCLLTNRRVLLDNNRFLEAKVGLCITAAVLLVTLCVTSLGMAHRIQKLREERERQKQLIEGLNQSLTSINERFSERDIHDAKTNLWKKEAFSGFLQKLIQRKAFPISIVQLRCADSAGQKSVLLLSQYLTDKSVLKFQWADRVLVLAFIQASASAVEQELCSLLSPEGTKLLCQIRVTEEGPGQEEIEEKLREGEKI